MSIRAEIEKYKIIAIIRGAQPNAIIPIIEALYSGGIRMVEITMNSVDPLTAIKQAADQFSGRLLIGAGTVLDVAMAQDAIHAGAQFILSPIVDEEVIQAAKSLNSFAIPGAYTATEIYRAYQAGAEVIKVFPATSPAYLKDLAGPLPQIPLLPTGGITVDNIRDFQQVGAIGFGVGSALVDTKQQVTDAYLSALIDKAQKFVQALTS